MTYLKKAGLLESPARGQYKITDTGIRIYKNNKIIDDNVLRQFSAFMEFKDGEVHESNEVDGTRLAELMIEYELGVSTQYVYQVKQIDSDYFSEE